VGRAGPKAIDFYAFSWGVPREPACNVVETAQRKSQTVGRLLQSKRVSLSMGFKPVLSKRREGVGSSYSYDISNAPASAPLRTFVWLSGVRGAVEQCCEEGKTELGRAHEEVRQYWGWHHHILTTMLAHFFLWHLQLRLGKKSPRADGVAGANVIGGRVTAAESDGKGRAGGGRVDPAAQSPGLSGA
jgi:hypothetical protein